MRNKIIMLLFTAASCLAGCQEAEIPLYSGGNHIQFVKDMATDSTTIAFLLEPGKTELEVPLIVKTTGLGYPVETPYKIYIDSRFTTAVEGTHFKMPATTTFKPGAMRDTLPITFYRTADMKTNTYRLVLQIEANDAFQLGQLEYLYMVFLVHDKISRPAWWQEYAVIEWRYLGPYSDAKYEYFIEATGVSDLTGATASEIRAYTLQFKYWLIDQKNAGHPALEANGDEITVPLVG
jgi:hypothetical protein